jgi:hypothetical protein
VEEIVGDDDDESMVLDARNREESIVPLLFI